MDTIENPPLGLEQREKIAVAQYEAHKLFWGQLEPLSGTHILALVAKNLHQPTPPKLSATLTGILNRYAVKLFDCEDTHYPVSPKMLEWRYALAARIETMVIKSIVEFEDGSGDNTANPLM
jgi:hypothetical protein